MLHLENACFGFAGKVTVCGNLVLERREGVF
jgi:hypothetical protein